MKISAEELEDISALAVSRGGKVWFNKVSEEFQRTVEALIYAEPKEVEVLRGKARALHEQITQVQKCVAAQGKK